MSPERAMRLALTQARRVRGRTWPNPAVGAVVFRGKKVLGRGGTRPIGGAHAEIVALAAAERRFGKRALRGASVAVTLEPCSHVGRTGPCADALIEAGIRRVHVGCRDPHRAVSGRGLRRMRRAGIDVQVGVLEAECREQHRGFLAVCERGRPFVTLKLASSLDGRIATRTGESRWITGEAARRRVHAMRAATDAILVGSGTAIADDPDLGARRGERVLRRPLRVLLDGRLRVPVGARLYHCDDERLTWVLCARGARGRAAVAATGARVVEVPKRGQRVDLRAALRKLGREGITELLVEGGGELGAALLRSGLVDELHWFTAPLLLGGDGRPALGSLGAERLADTLRLEGAQWRRVGEDWHLQARLDAGGGIR